ncbi:uncharacterized protein BYT42DRAFT_564193 [Radiomyces spectabilis]|uniref:uncharacterized protein n=1 Tax=Radiomyces spectabilis TaxID=64574 RepID=UPI002220933A|nr:uncharacterized protein BYT42DRAFT_564193 [Radiomyces spectabilis]KAI8384954.1 hypothetical protein BYT42DRAFT_564193 [Radiomyces spectabilis]
MCSVCMAFIDNYTNVCFSEGLGGVSTSPCGEGECSCFVYSDADPKGGDCIEKFKAVQNYSSQYPGAYGNEIDDNDNKEEAKGTLGDNKDMRKLYLHHTKIPQSRIQRLQPRKPPIISRTT